MAAESDHVDDFTTRMRMCRMLRQARGRQTIDDFARRLDVDPAQLERWETGEDAPSSVLGKALRFAGVPLIMFDLEQMLAAVELTESTRRVLNDPTVLLHRARQLIDGHGRLVGWALGMGCAMLLGTYTLSHPQRLATMVPFVAAPATSAPTPKSTVASILITSDSTPTPAPSPGPSTQPQPTLSPSPPSRPDPTPTEAPAPSPVAARVAGNRTPVPPSVAAPTPPAPSPVPQVTGLHNVIAKVIGPNQ